MPYSSKAPICGVSMHVLLHMYPCAIAGRGSATDLAATVVMWTDDCAWKQERSRLIRLSSTSERLLAGVRGRLMRKHKASAGLLSLFVCVGSAEVRLVGRVTHCNHTGLHTPIHTHSKQAKAHTHTDKDTQKARLYFDALTSLCASPLL